MRRLFPLSSATTILQSIYMPCRQTTAEMATAPEQGTIARSAAPLFPTRQSPNARHKRRTTPSGNKMRFPARHTCPPEEAIDAAMPALVITRSTELLEQTARACEASLSAPTPPLEREKHVAFLTKLGLIDVLPKGYVSLDASRPWMMYWTLCGLKMLGEDITPHRERCSLHGSPHPPSLRGLLAD
jgi:hypothetical protein